MLFAKLFRSQYDSSIANNYLTRWVFNDLVILSDIEGFVDMTHESIARITGVPLEIVRDAIASLMADDPMSRCKDHNGRRLVPLLDDDGNPRPWGWQIVNKPYYMKIKDAETLRERNRLRQQRHRVTKKRDKSVTVTPGHAASRDVTPNKKESKSKRDAENEGETSFVASVDAAAAPTKKGAYALYCALWADKYGTEPHPQKQDIIAAQTALKPFSPEEREAIIRAFVDDDDKWVVDKAHRLGLLPGQIDRLRAKMRDLEVAESKKKNPKGLSAEYLAREKAERMAFLKELEVK